jgi:exportin-1
MEVSPSTFRSSYLVHEPAQQGLLDFSREFDVSLMDKVVMTFYTGQGQEVRVDLPDHLGGAKGLTRGSDHSNKWLSRC